MRCRRCGHKLSVTYSGTRFGALRYLCQRGVLDNGEPRCIGFGGVPIDAAISREVLRVVQPAAVEAAVMASEDVARERDEVLAALQRDRPGEPSDRCRTGAALEPKRCSVSMLLRGRSRSVCAIRARLRRHRDKSWRSWLTSCKRCRKALTLVWCGPGAETVRCTCVCRNASFVL